MRHDPCPADLALFSVADLSTSHLSRHDARLLDVLLGDPDVPLSGFRYEEGYFLFLPWFLNDAEEGEPFQQRCEALLRLGFTAAFLELLKTLACTPSPTGDETIRYVNFDRDGCLYDSLPQYRW